MLLVFCGVVMETESKKRPWRVRESFAFVVLFLVVGSTYIAWQASQKAENYRKAWTRVVVKAPQSPPELGQDSIDLAIAMFGIKVPSGAMYPRFERDLVDRGVTVKSTFLDHNKVSIGPAAFSSWGLLGSTLAHELEVHCEQSFFAVWFLDLIGMGGTDLAERHAYLYEIKNKKRFGLKTSEAAMITETLEFYYPDFRDGEDESILDGVFGVGKQPLFDLAGPQRASLNRWLALNFIGPRHSGPASEK